MSEPETPPAAPAPAPAESPPRGPFDLGPAGDLKPGASAWVPFAAVKDGGVDPAAPARLVPDETFTVRVSREEAGFTVTGRQGPDPAPPRAEPRKTEPTEGLIPAHDTTKAEG
jgi:hypothetical protein